MRLRTTVFALLVLTAGAAHAADPVPFCGSQAPPLLYVLSSARYPPFITSVQSLSLIVQQGGFTVAVSFPRLPDSDLPLSTSISLGQVEPATYQRLIAALAAVRVGLQGNCHMLPLNAQATVEEEEITWYGKGRRTNTFTVTSRREPGYPECPPEMENLIAELGDFAVHLQSPQQLPAPVPRH